MSTITTLNDGITGASFRGTTNTNFSNLNTDKAEVTGKLSQFAATTSLELKGVISDETGSGALVFANTPTLVTPVLGVATATSINGATITSGTLNGSVTGTNTGDQTIANSSDATSHTVTLSASGGTVQFIEGTNISLATGGTASAGTLTITASGGSGDVTKVGTPVNNQIGVWTGDGTLEGDAALTFDTTTDTLATTLITATTVTANLVGNVTGNASGTAATVTTAAQPSITSLGTLTTLTVDDITVNGNTISSAGASTLAINPTAGQAITFDGTVTLDAGVIAGATSITSTTFVGALTGTASGNLVSGGALGTPSSGTLTNCTGLPVAGITPSTSTAIGVGSIELGHATDTSITRVSGGVIAVEGVTVPTISSTSTITNKRQQPRIVSAASYTTDTGTSLDVSTTDIFVITAQAGALLFNSPSGTPIQGEKLMIRIKDNGTARALTWNAVFRAMGTALPTTTVLSKTLYLGFVYNSTDTKWDLIASAQEA